MVYVPFTTIDLVNCQERTPRLRDDVDKVHQRFATIFATYDPTWGDCMALVEALLAPDEKRLVLEAAKKYLIEVKNVNSETYLPTQDPKWSYSEEQGRNKINQSINCIKNAIGKTLSWDKVHACYQKSDEHPSDYLTRLLTEFERHTCMDPHQDINQALVNLVYVAQAAPDIKRRIQQIEGFENKTMSELIKIATRVYVS